MTCRNHAVCPPCHARLFSITALAVIRTPCQVFALRLLTHASLAIKQLDDDAFQRRKFPSKKICCTKGQTHGTVCSLPPTIATTIRHIGLTVPSLVLPAE